MLGAFAIAFGLEPAISYTLVFFDQIAFFGLTNWILRAVFHPLAAGLALALAWATPRPLEDRDLLGISVAIGLGFSSVSATAGFLWTALEGATRWAESVSVFGGGFLLAAAVLWALRAHPSRGSSRGDVTQFGLLTLAVGIMSAFFSGLTLPETAEAMARGDTLGMVLLSSGTLRWLTVAGLWGRNMIQAGEDTVEIHRTTMLGILGLLAAGALWGTFSSGPLGGNVSWGVVRLLGLGLLAYGILRHDLAGLDKKVEYGLSKTTVAGIFVAVFFVVSEGAQALFADFAGNELIGVIAAGMLVFAISPLQRFADRFAARAVPGGAQAGQGVEERYLDAVETALADGEITIDEERHLSRLAERLGIDSERALELREQVEDEADGGAG